MRWPWSKDPDVEIPEDGRTESSEALRKSRQDLRDVQRQAPEVKKIARSLREIRETNHLAEQLRQALGGN